MHKIIFYAFALAWFLSDKLAVKVIVRRHPPYDDKGRGLACKGVLHPLG